jgi:hypothetical protein
MLLHEALLIRKDSDWGPPMTYAANLGRDAIIRLLHRHGATDLKSAAGRATLQGKAETVRMIFELAGRPPLDRFSLAGPAYTLSVEGTAVIFMLGARLDGPRGSITTPWSTCSGPTAGTRLRNTASWRCISNTASSPPTRR